MPRLRVEFTREHDVYLAKYLARYCPSKQGRSGRQIYERLVDNDQKLWPWSVHHTSQSWRERYVKNSSHFDAMISKYQTKDKFETDKTRKRTASTTHTQTPDQHTKRVKLDANEGEDRGEGPSGETHTDVQNAKPSSKPTSTPTPQPVRAPDAGPSTPRHHRADTHTVPNTVGISSSSPNRQDPPPMDDRSEPADSTNQLKKRSRAPSEFFASETSSPKKDIIDSVGGSSSPTRLTATSAGTDGGPVITYARAPPRVVNTFRGQVLVDQKGHVPRAFPVDTAEEDEGEEEEENEEMEEEGNQKEEEEDTAQWPPVRGQTTKKKEASQPDAKVDVHHAFSQPKSPLRPSQVLHTFERPQLLDRRAVVAQFSSEAGGDSHGVAPQVESKRREDAVQNGESPVERIAPPVPEPHSGTAPKPSSKASKFPAPRVSTDSPFRPESPTGKTRQHAPVPQPWRQLRTKSARHPTLARIRRQTIENGKRKEREGEQVPSVDLVALSSTSTRSHSRSPTSGSAPTRPRWSLPAIPHATPWLVAGHSGASSAPDSRPGSISGKGSASPFRAPFSGLGDIWARPRGRASIPLYTPSPVRSITAVATDGSNVATMRSPHVPLHVAPHPADVSLTSSHGLATLLAHMSANHGLALDVVEAVYAQVKSLSEADEILCGMREAAKGFGEREIERRMRAQRQRTHEREKARYKVASEDGEGSEYSPPETSRAAMWKRRSEMARRAAEEGDGKEERVVEEELRDVDGEEEEMEMVQELSQHISALEEARAEVADENVDRNAITRSSNDGREQQMVAEALVERLQAQALEKRMGRGRFRKDIVKRFI